MINKVILLGHLGRDPDVRTTSSGSPVATLSLATNRRWTNRDTGERQEETEWHRVVVWGRSAEVARQYLHKGSQIYVEGRLHTRSWHDNQTGEKRWSTEVVCNRFQMLGGGRGDNGDRRDPHPARTYSPPQSQGSEPDEFSKYDAEDEDIPF